MAQEFKTELLEKKKLNNEDVWFFRFGLLESKEINFISGQYILLEIDNNQKRPYSIASPNYIKNYFELVVKLLPNGLGSNYLRELKPGQESHFWGPTGFLTLKTKDKNKFFFAAGTGIAPFRSQILSLLKDKTYQPKLTLFWGLKKKESVYFFEELKNLSKENSNFTFKICLDQEKNFENLDKNYFYQGRIQQAFLDFKRNSSILDLNNFEYYLCGPPVMTQSVKEFLSQQGIRQKNIFQERF